LEHVEPIDFIVDDMLSPGLSMLAADPKIGKSWFSLLMCLCVSQGRKFLGYNTHKCNVLYLALEDSDNRMKSRIKRIFEGDKLPDTFNYCIEINDLSSGFIEQMELANVSTDTNGNQRYQRHRDIYGEPLTAVSALSGGRNGKEIL